MPEWRRLGDELLDEPAPPVPGEAAFADLLPRPRRRHAAAPPHPGRATMLTSLVRTLVPLAVGWLLTTVGLARFGVSDADLTPAVTALVTAAYYVAARLLEEHVAPRFGWLLGRAVTPTYANDNTIPGDVVGDSGPV